LTTSTPKRDSVDIKHCSETQVQFVRGLDALAYSLLAFGLLFLHPDLPVTPLGETGTVYVFPVLGIGGAVFVLLGGIRAGGDLAQRIWRLRLATLFLVALSPFPSWWVRAPANFYLLLMGFCAILSFLWFLMELGGVLREALLRCEVPRLPFEAAVCQQSVIYLSILPLLSVYAMFVVWYATTPGVMGLDFERLWFYTPRFLKVTMAVPPLLILRLLWQTRKVVLQSPAYRWQVIVGAEHEIEETVADVASSD